MSLDQVQNAMAAVQSAAVFMSHHGSGGRLEELTIALEKATVVARNELELSRPVLSITIPGQPMLKSLSVSGFVDLVDNSWLHIKLNTLLPHCRFQTPAYLTDTINRLLDEYIRVGRELPFFDKAMLIIDEHCDTKSRTVFDQDNKGWKVIPNALKGRVFPDDDQHTLGLVLVSTSDAKPACHIYVLPARDAGDFFMLRENGLM